MVAKSELSPQTLRMSRLFSSSVAVFFAAFTLNIQTSAQADTFGTSGNEFTIDFVTIGNAGNAADTTGYGAVPYEYRLGQYEISQDAIDKATASGLVGVTAGAWSGNQPAANISWFEAAAFVNYLNTSTGKTAAYNLARNGSAWTMDLWSSADAWQLGGENLYRNKDAYYILPSDNEWYKAAYYNPFGANYFVYPTASNSTPTAVASGNTDTFLARGTAVYDQPFGLQFEGGDFEFGMGGYYYYANTEPAVVDHAGGLSALWTMGQGGNVYEWNESASDGSNSSGSENRAIRGGHWYSSENDLLSSSGRSVAFAAGQDSNIGFRVASVPEPSTYALLFMAGAGWLLWRRRKTTR